MIPDWILLVLIPPAAIGWWALLGGLFHLIDWIHPNRAMKWARNNLVDASLDTRAFWKKEPGTSER